MNRFFYRIVLIVLASSVAALAVNALRPKGGVPIIRPSREELALQAGIVAIHLDSAKIYHADPRYLFVDARPANAFRRGRIPGSVHFDETYFDSAYPAFAAKVPKDRPLVVYCDGIECRASEVLSQKLKEKGYKYIRLFFGGWNEWRQAKLPIDKDPVK